MDPLPHHRRRSPLGVSVAELVSLHSVRVHHAPDDVTPRAAAPPVSVATLLRREGRGPHSADGPLRPRTRARPEPVDEPPRRSVRKAAAAAGALFALSTVFGASVVDEALSTRDADAGDGLAAPDDGDPAGAGGTGAENPGVGLTTALAQLPAAGGTGSPVDTFPLASGADIGRNPLAGPLGTGPVPPDPGPVADTPVADTPVAGAPIGGPVGGDAPAGGSPVGAVPGAGTPGSPPADPDAGSPGTGNPGSGGPWPRGPVATVPLPDLGTPEVTLPGAARPVPSALGRVAVPAVTLSGAAVDAPGRILAAGPALSVSRTAVTTADLEVDDLSAGTVGLTGASAALPDVVAESEAPLLALGPEPEVTLPALTFSEAELTTPDLTLGESVVEVPDLATPALTVPEVPVLDTVTGLLGL